MYCSIHTTVHSTTYRYLPNCVLIHTYAWQYALIHTPIRAWRNKKGQYIPKRTKYIPIPTNTQLRPERRCYTCSNPVCLSELYKYQACWAAFFWYLLVILELFSTPCCMHRVMPASYAGDVRGKVDQPGTGSSLFYINSLAMVFPSEHLADWKPNLEHEAAAKTDGGALKGGMEKSLESLRA